MSQITRYSESDLAEFKAHIDAKLEKGREYLALITGQLKDLQENKDNEGDWMDDTSASNDLQMLFTMETRQRKHLRDLENALIRIRNKSYGICTVTGELIDRRRLMAVPTTFRSIEAKMAEAKSQNIGRATAPKRTGGSNRIISKVLKKKESVVRPVSDDFLEEDYHDSMDMDMDMDIDLDIDLDIEVNEGIDLDGIATEE